MRDGGRDDDDDVSFYPRSQEVKRYTPRPLDRYTPYTLNPKPWNLQVKNPKSLQSGERHTCSDAAAS
jgi:hypothetical protein